MARYKETEKGQGLLLPVILSEQLLPGTFEYTLNHLVDNKLNLSIFDGKYNNDITGAKAIEPGILLKIILYCYSQGIISSRKIAKMCENHIIVKALACETEPHYTTISNFVSGMSVEIEKIFGEVLLVCHELKLIGGKMFAIDGCRLPSNASKEYSGTKEELMEKYKKIKKICREILKKHRENDRLGKEEISKDKKKLKKMKRKQIKYLSF
jgi:transposase